MQVGPRERRLDEHLDRRPDEPGAEPDAAAAEQYERARGEHGGGVEPEVGDRIPGAVVVDERQQDPGEPGVLGRPERRHHVVDGALVEPGEGAERDRDREGGEGGCEEENATREHE